MTAQPTSAQLKAMSEAIELAHQYGMTSKTQKVRTEQKIVKLVVQATGWDVETVKRILTDIY
jgi:hypothetical protein